MAGGLSPDRRFWANKRVFLTGHSGFKGTWLAFWLRRLGATVMGFSLPPETNPSLSEQVGLDGMIDTEIGDIRDASALSAAMRSFAPDIVLHLAAQALVQRSYREPTMTFETNVLGTVNVLQAVRQTGSVRAVVVVTTDKCYENREWAWPYREIDALGGYDPYSASKACTELAVAAWRQSYFQAAGDRPVAVATARAGNVIGGGDWADNRLIPDCIRALSSRVPIQIRNPNATRPWQHVLEPLCGYLILAEALYNKGDGVAEAWNFGPPMEDILPVSGIADLVTALWGEGASWERIQSDAPHEAGLLAVDAAKARSRLGWKPRLPLADALAWSVAWYKAQRDGRAAAELIAIDIENYENIGAASYG